MAREVKDLAIIRGMSTKEGDHGRATYHLRTGYLPQEPVRYPTLGSLVAKELEDESAELPGFVSIAPARTLSPMAFSSGFLGPKYAPLIVGERAGTGNRAFRVDDLDLPAGIGRARADDRLELMHALGSDFQASRPGVSPASHQDAYTRAVRMMRSPAAKAFELEEEPDTVRDAYGRNPFGQGCLLARRLVEKRGAVRRGHALGRRRVGTTFWVGTRTQARVRRRREAQPACSTPAWSTLMTDLRTRGPARQRP